MAPKRNTGFSISRNYHGDLGKPIDVEMATEAYVRLAKAEKLVALFREFGIPIGDWKSLAINLAEWHVPGFQISYYNPEKRGGRPSKKDQDDQDAFDLTEAVEKIIDEAKTNGGPRRRTTIKGACEYIATSSANKRWTYPSNLTTSEKSKFVRDMGKKVSRGRNVRKERSHPPAVSCDKPEHGINPEFLDELAKHFQKPPLGSVSGKT